MAEIREIVKDDLAPLNPERVLHVILQRDGSGWFAQSLEIDYAACGESIAKVKKNFVNGLALTAREHVRVLGNTDKLFLSAKPEAWENYLAVSPERTKLSRATFENPNLPGFEVIQFVSTKASTH